MRAGGQREARPSLLPFDPAQLTAVRVKPVEFARMCGVSRQAVSKWIKRGLFTVGPDGRFDPALAWRQVLECSDPARLRARVFKDAVAPVAALRERIADLEAERAHLARAVANRCGDETAERLGVLVRCLVIDWQSLERAPQRERALWALVDSVFYPDAVPAGEAGADDEDEDDEADDERAGSRETSPPGKQECSHG